MNTFFLIKLIGRPLFWLLQDIVRGFYNNCTYIVTFIVSYSSNDCVGPWWIISSTYRTLIISLLLLKLLDTHKKANYVSNMILIYPCLVLFKDPSFWIHFLGYIILPDKIKLTLYHHNLSCVKLYIIFSSVT